MGERRCCHFFRYWKGFWDGINHLAGTSYAASAVTFSTGLLFLLLTGTVRTPLSPPVGVIVDTPEGNIASDTYLSSGPDSGWAYRLADALVSRLVELSVILMWHGVWTMTDLVLEVHLGMSNWSSTMVGYCCGLAGGMAVFVMQFPLLWLCEKFPSGAGDRLPSRLPVYLYNVAFCVVGTIATISSFRAYWYLLDLYYLTDNYTASLVTGQIFGALGLIALNCASCLHAGIFKDSIGSEGCCVSFYYLSYFYIRDMKVEKEEDSVVL